MRGLLAAIRSLRHRARFEREMRDELRVHVEQRADDLAAAGLPRPEALRRAQIEFGALEAYKEQCRDAGGFAPARVLHGLGGDLTLATRRLAAAPLFTAFAVLSLAVGLGVTTAAYSVVAAVFFTSTGVEEDERVAFVFTRWDGKLLNGGLSTPDFQDLRAGQSSFTSLAASAAFMPSVASPTTTDLMRGEAVDGVYFSTLGVRPLLGRAIDEQDVAAGSPVVVLSHLLWSLYFGSDPAIVGRDVRIGGRVFEVVGVAPSGFDGLGRKLKGTRVWIPLSAADPGRGRPGIAERDRPRLVAVGRLAPGATLASASAELSAIGTNLDRAHPRQVDRAPAGPLKRDWLARPLADDRPEDIILFRFGVAFVALVALVLVVACTNLANLVLARGTARQQELAVRRALGASRWRLVREQCAESVIVAVLGAGAALLIFRGLTTAIDINLPWSGKQVIPIAPTLDPAVLAIASASLLLALVVFGLEPAMRLTRHGELRTELATAAGSIGVPKRKRQRALVRWQVAICTGFFIIGTMCVKYAIAEARHDSGIDMDRIAIATMNFSAQQWDEARARHALARVLAEAGQDPVVESAAVATGVPFGATATQALEILPSGAPVTEAGAVRRALGIAASPGYFQTLGIEIVRGRAFDQRDMAGGARVVVLSEETARHLFGTADAVGRQLLMRPRAGAQPARRSVARALSLPTATVQSGTTELVTMTVVGVSANTDVGQLFARTGNLVYMPIEQQAGGMPFGIAVVRTSGSPAVALRALRDAIRRVDPDLAIESAGTGIATLGGPTVFLRAGTLFAVSLGGLTLALAMVGLYGVQAQGVAYRTRELGVRMSLGATAGQIRALVLRDGYGPVVQGIALGVFIGIVGRGLARAFLWDAVEVADAWMLLIVPLPIVAAAFCACYIPARRASRVDPNVALRHL